MMKALYLLISLVFVSVLPGYGQDDGFHDGGLGSSESSLITVNRKGGTVGELLAWVSDNAKDSPNFMYNNGADKVAAPPLNLRGVSLKGLVESLCFLLDFRPHWVDGRTVILVAPLSPSSVKKEHQPVESLPSYTNVYPVEGFGVEAEALIDVVKNAWSLSTPGWENVKDGPRILYHAGTEVMIVRGNEEALSEIEVLIQALKNSQQSEVSRLRNHQSKLEERYAAELDRMKAQVAEMQRDRVELLQKVRELELEKAAWFEKGSH